MANVDFGIARVERYFITTADADGRGHVDPVRSDGVPSAASVPQSPEGIRTCGQLLLDTHDPGERRKLADTRCARCPPQDNRNRHALNAVGRREVLPGLLERSFTSLEFVGVPRFATPCSLESLLSPPVRMPWRR